VTDLSRIRLLVCDVDGVLTDGRIIYDSTGAETKQFHVRDGSGLKYWQRAGHAVALLSGRSCRTTERRAEELGIGIVHQGVKDKWPVMERILDAAGCTADEAAYVGDDLPDLPVMYRVGCPVAVADAVAEVRAAACRVTTLGGGQGAVRETIEWILRAQGRWDTIMARYARPGE
jgi:YrbI family 3-deoxy-D-manno-octulosonate 8-phosphate phosphatase